MDDNSIKRLPPRKRILTFFNSPFWSSSMFKKAELSVLIDFGRNSTIVIAVDENGISFLDQNGIVRRFLHATEHINRKYLGAFIPGSKVRITLKGIVPETFPSDSNSPDLKMIFSDAHQFITLVKRIKEDDIRYSNLNYK